MSHREFRVKVVTWMTVTSSREMAVYKGRWWEIRGTDGGVCCPGSTRNWVGVPIHGNDCLLWQVSVDTGSGSFSESHQGDRFLDSCSLFHCKTRQYPFIDDICKCLYLWGVWEEANCPGLLLSNQLSCKAFSSHWVDLMFLKWSVELGYMFRERNIFPIYIVVLDDISNSWS